MYKNYNIYCNIYLFLAMDMSYWIKFFTEAGIPASDAAHYAVLFTDNRIQRGMLIDLNKEYLIDMGVTRLGDIIGILKYAKIVHAQVIISLYYPNFHIKQCIIHLNHKFMYQEQIYGFSNFS